MILKGASLFAEWFCAEDFAQLTKYSFFMRFLLDHLAQLEQGNARLSAIIETIPMRVFWKDRNSRYLGCNTAFARDCGELGPEGVIGKTDEQLTWRDHAEQYRSDDREVMESAIPKLAYEEFLTTPDGGIVCLRKSKLPLAQGDGHVVGVLGVYEDITGRKAAQEDLRIAATAFESQVGMVIVSVDGHMVRVNQAFSRITGFSSQEAVGQTLSLLKSQVQTAAFYESMWRRIAQEGTWQGEIINRRKGGAMYAQWLTITAVKDDGGTVTHYVGTMLDITDRKAIETRVQHLAHHDPLTDLPNRILLTDRLQQALAQARRERAALALIYLDLDRFKPVNDSLGHDVGDALLKEVALRLRSCVSRESDTVSRIGGDEFVLLLAQIESEADAAQVAQTILQALTRPYQLDGHTLEISCSIGIAMYPTHGTDAKTLMKHADNAMYQAKNAGRSCHRFYEP